MTSGPRRRRAGEALLAAATSVSTGAAAARNGWRGAGVAGARHASVDARRCLKSRPALAQAAADHAQLHQLNRAFVAIAVGLDVLADEAGAPARHDHSVVVVHSQFGRLALVAQVRLPAQSQRARR